MKRVPVCDDSWLIENFNEYPKGTLYDAYMKAHPGSKLKRAYYRTRLSKLGLTYRYTDEQRTWLIENYPTMSGTKAAEEFNKKFHCKRTVSTLYSVAHRLGVRTEPDLRRSITRRNVKTYQIGKEITRTHSDGNSSIYVKTENGWVRKTHLVVGDVPKNCGVYHLDNNYKNNNAENLVIVSRNVQAIMAINRFWSEDPEITKTGLICSELHLLVKDVNSEIINKMNKLTE